MNRLSLTTNIKLLCVLAFATGFFACYSIFELKWTCEDKMVALLSEVIPIPDVERASEIYRYGIERLEKEGCLRTNTSR